MKIETVNRRGIEIAADQHALRYVVPGPVWQQGKFLWRPELTSRGLTAQLQYDSVAQWQADSKTHQHFVVTAHEASKAEYFAAMLVGMHMATDRHAEVFWFQVRDEELDRYTAQFTDPVPVKKREAKPTLLVLTGLGLESTNVQVEKARDAMNRFPATPVIIAGASKFIDPLDFAKYMMISFHRAVHINPIRAQLDV